ncbi:hypothetical protein SFRURICE_012795 [Spodoptera frugiperda]|nr:hypothetical protein SFRURICE_012795 [Spodoptera frugiperda]
MSVLWFIVSAYVLVVGPIQAARILFYIPTPSISHQVVYRPLAQTLASRGHDVTVITTDPAFPKGHAPANITEIDLHDISYEIWQEQLMKEAREDVGDLRAQLATIMKTMYMVLDKQLQDERIQTLVNDKNKQFDLLLLEAVLPPLLHFGPAVPKIEELVNNIDMIFLNIHPMFEGIRPVPPNVVYLHGLHQKPTKDLPQDLKSYLDLSKHGVIYVSFGTNVDPALLPPEKIQILLRVFSQLPYDILWKWSKDELPGRSPNIRIAKWFPQPDLLKHPNVKLFITQGGLQSTDEAITAGVPLIGMPMLGDQYFNVERYVYYGFGIRLNIKTLTEEKLKHAINATIADDSYRRNMERFRTIINDSPQTPLERAVWWTEYVLRHGDAKHLRAPTARILFYIPTPSISHQVVYRPLAQELASRGHNVTVITADPAFPKGKAPANLTEIDLHDISYGIWHAEFMKGERGGARDLAAQVEEIAGTFYKVFDRQLEDEQIQTLINDKSQQFDLLILEAVLPPLLVFSHIYKAPVIQVSSFGAVFGTYESVGAPTHPLLYPLNTRQKLRDLTLWDKFTEVFIHYAAESVWYSLYNVGNNILKKHFGPEVPKIEELVNNIDMIFMNIHPMLEGIRPVPPNVVYLHGLHQKPTKDLPQDLKSYLDSSKHGVIYVSFGTNIDPALLLPEKIQILLRVFSQLPYDILWKWSKDELPGRSPNIRIAKWFPQPDLLKHPNVKLFITQGGLQSTDEAITAGVPLIGMPMLGDQHFNVERYVSYGFGTRVDMETLTEEKLQHAINATIADDSYRRNMERFRTIINDSPQTPLERAVWWTEYVLRHGDAKHLRAPSANISWRQYLELDLVLILLSVLLIAVTVSVIVLRLVYRAIRSYLVSDVKIKRS